MRISDLAKLAAAGASVLAGLAPLAGCTSVIDGQPVAAPDAALTEPSEPSSPLPPPTPTKTTPPPTSTAPNGAIPLPPDANGYVFIETKSGQTRCQIDSDNVGCEAAFTNSPIKEDTHANGVNVSADGDVQWVLGNLGDIPTITIDYRTYEAEGWTIEASLDGTRFTNNRTEHGMFVSIENVETF